MIFTEINRISNSALATINPPAKLEPRRVRRAKQREAQRQQRLEARSLGAAANQNINTIKQEKKSV